MNKISISSTTGAKTISSVEIAKLTGKHHRNLTGDIERILKEAEIDAQEFLRIYIDSQNRQQKCYCLPRFECDLVVSGYSVKYRAAIIRRWHELEGVVAELPGGGGVSAEECLSRALEGVASGKLTVEAGRLAMDMFERLQAVPVKQELGLRVQSLGVVTHPPGVDSIFFTDAGVVLGEILQGRERRRFTLNEFLATCAKIKKLLWFLESYETELGMRTALGMALRKCEAGVFPRNIRLQHSRMRSAWVAQLTGEAA